MCSEAPQPHPDRKGERVQQAGASVNYVVVLLLLFSPFNNLMLEMVKMKLIVATGIFLWSFSV